MPLVNNELPICQNGITYVSNGQNSSGGDIEVIAFNRQSDPIYVSNGIDNFWAEFTIQNNNSTNRIVDDMAIDIVNPNGSRFDIWHLDSSTTLSPGETFSSGKQSIDLWYAGDTAVEVRLQIDGDWETHARKEFHVYEQPTDFPDLVVESPSVDDSTLSPGDSYRIYATVRNAGNASAAVTTLRYYLSTDSNISTSDTEISTDAVDALAAGATSPEDKGEDAPSTAGTYWVGACVDTVSGESNTDNQCSSGVQITVAEEPTNQDPTGFFDSASCDALIGWAYDPDTTASIYVHFYQDGPAGSGTYFASVLANIYRSDLALSDKYHGFSLAAPSSLKDGQSHSIYVYAIDSQGGNNPELILSPRTVQCNPTLPDLVVESPSVDDATLTPSQSYRIYATVRNAGNGAASATTLR